MKIESRMFLWGTPIFVLVGVVYGIMTDWKEPVGYLAMPLIGGLVAMIGAYLALTARRIDDRPEDDPDGNIEDAAGDQGIFAPWSWWPLAIAGAAAICFLGLAVGWWVFYIGFCVSIIALVGWVFEYSRGIHSH